MRGLVVRSSCIGSRIQGCSAGGLSRLALVLAALTTTPSLALSEKLQVHESKKGFGWWKLGWPLFTTAVPTTLHLKAVEAF